MLPLFANSPYAAHSDCEIRLHICRMSSVLIFYFSCIPACMQQLENMISNIKVALASFDTTHKYKTKIRRKNLKPMCSKDGNKECTQTDALDLQTCPYTEQVKMKTECDSA